MVGTNDLKVRYTVSVQDIANGVAKSYGVEYLDAGTIIKSSEEDGLHLQADQHKILGEKVAEIVKGIL